MLKWISNFLLYCTFLCIGLYNSQSSAQVFDGHLIFPPELNGIQLVKKDIDYDFSQKDIFILGGKTFKYDETLPVLTVIGQAPRRLNRSSHKHHRLIAFDWPEELVEFGKLEIIDIYYDDIILSMEINENVIAEWRATPEKIREFQYPVWGETRLRWLGPRVSFRNSRFGFYPIPEPLDRMIAKNFRYCTTEENSLSSAKLCSVTITSDRKGNMTRSRVKHKIKGIAEVKVNGKGAPLKGQLPFAEKFDFAVKSANGFSYTIKGSSIETNLLQILKNNEKDSIEVLGHGVFPHGARSFGDGPRLLEKLGWQDSILPEKHYWNLDTSSEQPSIPALTSGASFISYTIENNKGFPSLEDRLKIIRSPKATYSSTVHIKGQCQSDCKNLMPQNKDQIEVSGKNFEWTIHTPKKNDLNYNQIQVTDSKGSKWVAQNEVFRASSTEISSRFSGFATTDSVFAVLGELSFSHWFESLFGWQNSVLSYQRWGLRANYSKTLKDILIAQNLEEQSLATLNADLKYRLKSGVSGLNETLGLNLSYQQTDLSGRNLPLVGGGIFWEKSMPVIFDRFLNLLPFMEYPKWVDMEFVVFPASLSSEITTSLMWNLNFHGKVLWSKSFFGELGFGIRKFDLIDQVQKQQFKFFSVYLTLGIGIQF